RASEHASDSPQLDAELIVGHVTGLDRVGLRTKDDTVPTDAQGADIEALVLRRLTGEPIAYLLGTAWFYGREFQVDSRVLVPRPETELLVELALTHLAQRAAEDHHTGAAAVVDTCTGSGCVGISIAASSPTTDVTCTDISEDALDVARANAARLAPRVALASGDLLRPAEKHAPFAVVTANPPYVEGSQAGGLEQRVVDHEPHVALFVPDGGVAAIYGDIAQQAAQLLEPGGLLAVEHGSGQRHQVVDAFERAGLVHVHGVDDLAGIDRVVIGYRPTQGG
ncbi:MAG: peptide chain release factor N(5)-glutamine methyltransferase, partial [Thermoleophilia bacterium]|nr:peptide chain release factor N(5)-glutamine methyltransferase [Thermoleophilia bacterium]